MFHRASSTVLVLLLACGAGGCGSGDTNPGDGGGDTDEALDCSTLLEPLDATFNSAGRDPLYVHAVPSGWIEEIYIEEDTGGGVLGRMTHGTDHPIFEQHEVFWMFSQIDEDEKDAVQLQRAIENHLNLGFETWGTIDWNGEQLQVLERTGLGIAETKIYMPWTTPEGLRYFEVQLNLRGLDSDCQPEVIEQMDNIVNTLEPNVTTTFSTD